MIVCLGWGSLIWRPVDLPVGDWRDDGPEIKVEFVRESTDHRLTLMLDPDADDPVTSPWGIVKLRLTTVSDAQHGGFTADSSAVSWGSID